MKKTNRNIIKGVIPLLFLVSLLGCKKESSNIGLDLRSDGGVINSEVLEFSNIICRTIKEDSLKTDSLFSNLLGAINDPVFGLRQSTLTLQPKLVEFGQTFSTPVVDSVTLTLKYDRSQFEDGIEQILNYGDLTSVMSIDVYKLGEAIDEDSTHYSSFEPKLGDKVGNFTGQFMFFDSATAVVDGNTLTIGPELRITLDNSFGDEILGQPSTTFADQNAFLDYLKGMVLVPNGSSLATGEGAIVAVKAFSSSSTLTVYYNDSMDFNMVMGNSSSRISSYSIENVPSDILNQVNGTGHFNTTYAQSLAGHKVFIELPELDTLIEKGEQIVINEAKLEIMVDQTYVSDEYRVPYRALLVRPRSTDGSNQAIQDFIDDVAPPGSSWVGHTNYGGRYSTFYEEYEFHFNRYLQSLINNYIETGVNSFNGFYIAIPSDNPLTPGRAVFNTDPSSGGIKVSVSYTKLN